MQFDPAQILATLNSYSGLIQAIIVLLTLGYAAWQTRRLGKQIQLNMITSAASHLKDVNQLMAEHPEFAAAVDGTSEGAFADIVFGTFSLWCNLKKQGLIREDDWKYYEASIRKVMRSVKMKEHWNQDSGEYDKDLRELIKGLI